MRATLRVLLAAGFLGAGATAGLLGAGCGAAAAPAGCDQFRWPIAHEQAALAAPAAGPLASGATLPADSGARLKLVVLSEAKVTLSAGGWIDVIQGGKFLRPIGFSEVTGCANARKSVKFRLAAEPATLQLSGVGEPDVAIIVSPE